MSDAAVEFSDSTIIQYRMTIPATLAFIVTMLCLYLLGQYSIGYEPTPRGDRVDVTARLVENGAD